MANAYDVGDQIRCTGTVTNTAGSVVDPSALTFRYKRPSGSVTIYTYGTDAELVRDSTGVYYVDITTTEKGTWSYRFASTSGAVAAGEGEFIVLTSEF